MLRFRELLRQMRFGVAVAALIVTGTALYVELYGPLYGVWGWPELVLGGLILGACAMAGVEAMFRPPNPYTRTYALYNLRDVPPNRDLSSGGDGWMIQSIPLAVTALVLAGIFLIT